MPIGGYSGFMMAYAGLDSMTGFQFANALIELEAVFAGILLYLLFISAIIGLVIGVLLLLKKKAPVFVDWIIHIVCITGCIYFFADPPDMVLVGMYFISAGIIIAVITQIISAIRKEG